jgi:uncharacterized membrane protein YqhA
MARWRLAEIRSWPEAPAVRANAILAVVWSLVALLEFAIYAIFVVPSLGESFVLAMPTKRGELDIPVQSVPALQLGLTVTISVVVISVVWMLLIPRLLKAAYVWFFVVSAFIAAYATGVLLGGAMALDGPTQPDGDQLTGFVMFGVFIIEMLSISAVYGRYHRGAPKPVTTP